MGILNLFKKMSFSYEVWPFSVCLVICFLTILGIPLYISVNVWATKRIFTIKYWQNRESVCFNGPFYGDQIPFHRDLFVCFSPFFSVAMSLCLSPFPGQIDKIDYAVKIYCKENEFFLWDFCLFLYLFFIALQYTVPNSYLIEPTVTLLNK